MRTDRCSVLGCECGCHRAKRRQVPRLWTLDMDAHLAMRVADGEHPDVIAASMHLTVDSIKWRIRQLGLSLRDGWRSRQETAAALGVGRRAINRWMRDGHIRVTRHGRRWTRIMDADLQAFIASSAGVLFDPSGVTDPGLRSLAETSALVNHRRALQHDGRHDRRAS